MNRFERNIGVAMSRLRGVKRTAALVAVVALSLTAAAHDIDTPAREGRPCRSRGRRLRPAGPDDHRQPGSDRLRRNHHRGLYAAGS